MSITEFISNQLPERQPLLREIHDTIVMTDSSIIASVEPMMGKEMILYKASHTMKYGLSSVKKYMSLHILPIYASPVLHSKYKALLPNASFQKGCINFISSEEIPMSILRRLFEDCAKIDLNKIREAYIQSKKDSKK